MSIYRAEDFQTPALGIVIRWHLIGIQIGRRNYIAARTRRSNAKHYPKTSAAVTTRKAKP